MMGGAILIALALHRLHYSYTTIRTDNFIIELPQPWLHRSVYVLAFLELCCQTVCISFALAQTEPIEVEIRPSWRPAFWFSPDSGRIVLCFLLGPAIDRWLFLIYFAIAHEYAHSVSLTQFASENEAWANLFCLYTLWFVASDYQWPHIWEHWLMRRDALSGFILLHIWQFLPGCRHKIANRFWELWKVAQEDSRSVVSIIHQED
jgi:hypothetical protein